LRIITCKAAEKEMDKNQTINQIKASEKVNELKRDSALRS
jgi:hypothetical protein